MSEVDDEVYSTIFNALRHGVRRRILRMLSEKHMTFTSINENLSISSSHLTYHLDSLKELVSKNDSNYRLSVFGRAAVDMMSNVENPPNTMDIVQGQNLYKIVSGGLIITILVVSGLYYNLYNHTKAQKEMLVLKEQEVMDVSAKLAGLAGLPELYNVTKGKWNMNIAQQHKMQYAYIAEANKYPEPERYYYFDPVEDSVMVFYAPLDNVVLQVYLTIRNLPEDFYLPVTLQRGNALLNESGVVFQSHEFMGTTYFEWQSPVVWSRNVTGWGGWIEIEIQERGWYTLSLTGPVEISSYGSPSVAYMWGERHQWLDILSMYVDANCKLLKNGEAIYFAMQTGTSYGHYGWLIDQIEQHNNG